MRVMVPISSLFARPFVWVINLFSLSYSLLINYANFLLLVYLSNCFKLEPDSSSPQESKYWAERCQSVCLKTIVAAYMLKYDRIILWPHYRSFVLSALLFVIICHLSLFVITLHYKWCISISFPQYGFSLPVSVFVIHHDLYLNPSKISGCPLNGVLNCTVRISRNIAAMLPKTLA